MTDDRAQIHVKVSREAKELAKQKLKHGELSQLFRDELRRVAYGDEVSKRERLQRNLEEIREEKDSLRAEKREIEGEIERVETEIARVEERMDGLERKEDRFDAQIEMLEEALAEGMRLDPKNPKVITAAKTGGVETDEVIGELRDRHPNIPDQAFKQKLNDQREWNGFNLESGE